MEAINELRGKLTPGMTVWTTVRHCSRSGMYRAIDLYYIVDGGQGHGLSLR